MSEQRFRGPSAAPGSYCLAICYCGEHDNYVPFKATTPSAPTTDTRQAESWADREEPTWLDR